MRPTMIIYPENTHYKIGFEPICKAAARKSFTPYGREKIETLTPSSQIDTVQKQLALASEWMSMLQSDTRHPLCNLEDIRPVLKNSRVEDSLLLLDDFIVVLQNARAARIIKQFFDRTDENQYPAVKEIVGKLYSLHPLEKSVERVITERGELRDDASPALKSIRGRINRERNRLRNTIQQVMKQLSKSGMTSDEGPTIRSGRMVIPIQAEYKRKVEGFVHDVSSTGQTIYLEPVQALQINNEIRQLEAEEQREIERIIRELTGQVRKFRDELAENCNQLGALDALHCKVSLGMDLEGAIPQLTNKTVLNLIGARNPNLLLRNLTLKNPETVVPLDLRLLETERALVITGPNAGGKSVAMKTVGLLSMMVQSGFPVPMQPDSTLPVIAGLFVDVGDDQSIENDLSTFSSRLNWMRNTLQQIQPSSLVLIDEAGAGTDPEEGGALFQAFVEQVIEAGARAMVTTHHGSLKVFAHEHKQVVNGAMEFNQEDLAPTYRFKKGVPGSSYAFEIADRMDLSHKLMQRARQLLGKQRDSMGELLVNLEKQMQESEELHQHYSSKLKEIKKRENVYADRVQQFEKKRGKILEKAYKDAEEIMKGANRRIEEAVEKIVQEGRGDREKIKEARKDIRETKKEIHQNRQTFEQDEENPYRSREKPVVGDTVFIGDSDTPGELIDIAGTRATVLVNGMKIKAKVKQLIKTTAPGKESGKTSTRSYGGAGDIDLSVKPRLDLRGYRGDDAVKELTLYLDKAVARGLSQVEIIHGKGEGILHKLVHKELDKRSEVMSFDIAPWESGGSGCTVVKLK